MKMNLKLKKQVEAIVAELAQRSVDATAIKARNELDGALDRATSSGSAYVQEKLEAFLQAEKERFAAYALYTKRSKASRARAATLGVHAGAEDVLHEWTIQTHTMSKPHLNRMQCTIHNVEYNECYSPKTNTATSCPVCMEERYHKTYDRA